MKKKVIVTSVDKKGKKVLDCSFYLNNKPFTKRNTLFYRSTLIKQGAFKKT